MSSSISSVNQYSLIFDQVYKQKHNILSQKVLKWLQQKQHYLNINYKRFIQSHYNQIQSQHNKFYKRIHQLLKVTNSQFQILNKVKSINNNNNDDNKHLSSSSISSQIIIQPSILSIQQISIYQSAIQKTNKKSSIIYQLSQFSSRFFAITSIELNQFKSLTSQIENHKQRYLYDYKKQIIQSNKINHQLCLVNQYKYFHLLNYNKLKQYLNKQIKILSKTNLQTKNYYTQSLNKRKQILQNIIDNITKFQSLYSQVFIGNLLIQIKQYYQQIILDLDKLIHQFQNKQKIISQCQKQTQKQLQQLYSNIQSIFNFAIQQITLGQWRHIELQTTKKSSFTSSFSSISFTSNHGLRQQTIYEIQNKQYQASNKINNNEQLNKYIMTLTLDYKLIFRKQCDKCKIYKQYLLIQLKIKNDKQKQISDTRTLILKQKKSKSTIQLTFPDTDKRQQFLLHIERFQQLKSNINK